MRALAAALLVVTLLLAGCGPTSQDSGESAAAPAEATTQAASQETQPDGPPAPETQPVEATGPRGKRAVVESVIDGDTLVLRSGRRVRLVQIDAPEAHGKECYGAEATAELRSLLPSGTVVTLLRDARLDAVDRYGRLLRYVYLGRRNLNVVLVRRGAATVWFYDGDRGRFADRFLRTAKKARAEGRGLWGACPGTPFDTSRGADTGDGAPPPVAQATTCAGAIPWDEAVQHEGERATVEGPVIGAVFASGSNGRPTFLNIGVDYPDPRRFTAVIWGDDRGAFPQPPEEAYAGRTVCVSGKIELYRGSAEIEVRSPDQILVAG